MSISPVPARPASTVVLVRPAHQGFEVFLVRRHDQIAFMGGAHVFPGGRVDPQDHRTDPAKPFHVAAIRELFEEAGVLLARDASGGMASMRGASHQRFVAYRRELIEERRTLDEIVRVEALQLAPDRLALFAHWVTPDIETKRFDTRFFLALAPDGQDAVHDERETTEGLWITPSAALARCLSGDMALPPPTWTTFRGLEAAGSADEAWRWARAQPLAAIHPRVNTLPDGTREILLPGHPDYPALEGFTPRETRFVLRDGRWSPEIRR